MSAPTWPTNAASPEIIEAYYDHISRKRALTLEESLRLEWAIDAQKVNRRALTRREMMLAVNRAEETELADRIEDEMYGPQKYKVG